MKYILSLIEKYMATFIVCFFLELFLKNWLFLLLVWVRNVKMVLISFGTYIFLLWKKKTSLKEIFIFGKYKGESNVLMENFQPPLSAYFFSYFKT